MKDNSRADEFTAGSSCREQLEKLQEENQRLHVLAASRHQEILSSQEETSLLKSQLEEYHKTFDVYREAHEESLEEKDREIERLKGGRANEKAAGWISVKDKLPDPNQHVLFYCPKYQGVRIGEYRQDAIIYGGARYRIGDEVSHWAKEPLPPNSQEKTEQEIVEKNLRLFKELRYNSEVEMFLSSNRVEIHFDSSQQYLCYVNYKDGDGASGLGFTFIEALKNGFDRFNTLPSPPSLQENTKF